MSAGTKHRLAPAEIDTVMVAESAVKKSKKTVPFLAAFLQEHIDVKELVEIIDAYFMGKREAIVFANPPLQFDLFTPCEIGSHMDFMTMKPGMICVARGIQPSLIDNDDDFVLLDTGQLNFPYMTLYKSSRRSFLFFDRRSMPGHSALSIASVPSSELDDTLVSGHVHGTPINAQTSTIATQNIVENDCAILKRITQRIPVSVFSLFSLV